ncbi:MAG: transketolase, partial [Candidatus Zixiibacteriota bacterium]
MPLIDSKTNKTIREYTVEELTERANYMRGLSLLSLCSAGSGHSGGTLSVMDICTALYLRVARHDPKAPSWEDRDRIIWSAGHKAPALYASLALSEYFPEKELMKLRKVGSPFQGHPHWQELSGVEFSTGSLGQGLSLGVGVALAAELNDRKRRVFVISSDGEQQEGSMWEAAMSASHHRLDNLVLIIDVNDLQIDGAVDDVMSNTPLADRYRAFGWEAFEINGHNMTEIVENLERSRNDNDSGKPVVLICHTVKGKGVSFMENAVGWHGKPPSRDELTQALNELGLSSVWDVDKMLEYGREYETAAALEVDNSLPKFSRDFWWNASESMR